MNSATELPPPSVLNNFILYLSDGYIYLFRQYECLLGRHLRDIRRYTILTS
jgi:hypothetical protein